MDSDALKRRFYPEVNIGGFSHVDGTINFFNHLAAIIRPSDVILDFGAGRGAAFLDDEVAFRRNIADFKGRCSHIDACDVDPIVLQNKSADAAKVINPGELLPYDDNRFDIIIARYVFEHLDHPEFVASELLRILKPGGVIAATTPNKWGYIATSARLVPNRLHVKVLSRSQPDRKSEDVFPTRYKLNTQTALRRAFGDDAEIFITFKASEPAYHFGRPRVYSFLKWVNKHAPDKLLPTIDVYIRKAF